MRERSFGLVLRGQRGATDRGGTPVIPTLGRDALGTRAGIAPEVHLDSRCAMPAARANVPFTLIPTRCPRERALVV